MNHSKPKARRSTPQRWQQRPTSAPPRGGSVFMAAPRLAGAASYCLSLPTILRSGPTCLTAAGPSIPLSSDPTYCSVSSCWESTTNLSIFKCSNSCPGPMLRSPLPVCSPASPSGRRSAAAMWPAALDAAARRIPPPASFCTPVLLPSIYMPMAATWRACRPARSMARLFAFERGW